MLINGRWPTRERCGLPPTLLNALATGRSVVSLSAQGRGAEMSIVPLCCRLRAVADPEIWNGKVEDNVSAPSSFITNAHNELNARSTLEKVTYWKCDTWGQLLSLPFESTTDCVSQLVYFALPCLHTYCFHRVNEHSTLVVNGCVLCRCLFTFRTVCCTCTESFSMACSGSSVVYMTVNIAKLFSNTNVTISVILLVFTVGRYVPNGVLKNWDTKLGT